MLLNILDKAGYRVRIVARDLPEKHMVLSPNEIRYISKFEETELTSNDIYLYNCVGSYAKHRPEFRVNIARTTFETDRIPDSWVQELNKFNEVWVQSRFNKKTFVSSGIKVPLRLIPNFFDIRTFNPKGDKLPLPGSESFVFLSVFDLKKRKGYDVLLRAFLNEFSRDDNVALILKVRDGSKSELIENCLREHPKPNNKRPAIYLIDQMMTIPDILRLYRSCNAFVLPTRGEGWGRPFFEAMLMEMPAIGTNWSGHTDFMNDANSYLVRVASLKKIRNNENTMFDGHYWAEPSIKDLQKKMRRVTEHKDEAMEKARRARQELLEKYSMRETSAKVIRELVKFK